MTGSPSARLAEPLLAAKLAVPVVPDFMVVRPRLLDRLSSGDRPLTLLSAPAGSGKTSLLASWLAAGRAPGPVAWLTLGAGDDRPGVFWSYVVESLRGCGVALPPGLGKGEPDVPQRPLVTRVAAALSARAGPVTLVLDGMDEVGDRHLADDLDFLLRLSQPKLRMVVAGRWDPLLPLHRYRLAGQLREIRGADLAFDAAETAELLARHGVVLPDPMLSTLGERMRGWAAGLHLFAMSRRGRHDAIDVATRMTGEEGSIEEYLLTEVLAAQPPWLRDFLLKTSVVEELPAGLADALIQRSDSRRTLAALERANVFVEQVDVGRATYRYHPLFGELLRAQLTYDAPELVPVLHLRAAGWYADAGQLASAVRHAAAAGRWAAAAGLVVDQLAVGEIVEGPYAGQYAELFRGMPADVDGPEAAVVAAALAQAGGEVDRVTMLLGHVEEEVGAADEPSPALRLAVALLEAVRCRANGDHLGALRAAAAVEALLGEVPAVLAEEHPELRALALSIKGTAQLWAGDLDDAATTLSGSVDAASAAGLARPMLNALGELAVLEAYRGRLRRAEGWARDAASRAERLGIAIEDRPAAVEVALAWVAAERYDVAGARRHIRAAAASGDLRHDPRLTACLALVRSRLPARRGRTYEAFDLVRAARLPGAGAPLPAWLDRQLALGEARLLLAAGHPEAAVGVVKALGEPMTPGAGVVWAAARLQSGDADGSRAALAPVLAATGVVMAVQLDAWLIESRVAGVRGEDRRARSALHRALRLAAPEAFRRPFLEAPSGLRQLLREDERLAARHHWLQDPVMATAAAGAGQQALVEPLSPREREVLGHIAEMLPTQEIAATMYVSVNTVKTHVRSILRKLAVSGRYEAVRRARALGIL